MFWVAQSTWEVSLSLCLQDPVAWMNPIWHRKTATIKTLRTNFRISGGVCMVCEWRSLVAISHISLVSRTFPPRKTNQTPKHLHHLNTGENPHTHLSAQPGFRVFGFQTTKQTPGFGNGSSGSESSNMKVENNSCTASLGFLWNGRMTEGWWILCPTSPMGYWWWGLRGL